MAIVKGDDGRWITHRTEDEALQDLLEAVKDLTPAEKKILRSALIQARDGQAPPALKLIESLEFEEKPCPPEKFLEDPYYFGEIGKGTYDWIKEAMPKVFKEGYEEIVATGAQRTGKDFFASICVSYLLHLLLCLKDPQTSYGLAKGSNLYICFMSVTQEQSKDAMFSGLVEKLNQSPWFQKFKLSRAMRILTDDIRLPRGIVIKGAESTDMGVVGLNVCAVVIDEANIGRKAKAINEQKNQMVDRTEAIYQAVRRRIRQTFTAKAKPPTLLMTLGSRRYPSDFVERRIIELKGNRKALVYDMSMWAAKGRKNFSEKTFRVLVGNDQTASRIIGENEKPLPNSRIVEIPEDFRRDFETDCDGSLRDIAGIAVRVISPYFANQSLIYASIDTTRTHPVQTVEWRIDQPLQIDWDKLTAIREGRLVPLISPDKPRCVSIDLGRTKNPAGISLGFIKGWRTVDRRAPDGRLFQENLPVIVVEFMLRVLPPQGGEIKFFQIREMVFDFVKHGIPIKYAVLDHWQSMDSIDLFNAQGIDACSIKTDFKAYDNFKSAVYEGRVRWYEYKPLMDELTILEEDPKKRKIDNFSEDTGNIHHDVADSVCMLVNRLSSDFKVSDYQPIAPEGNVAGRGKFEDYVAVKPGDVPFPVMPEEKQLALMQPIPESPQVAYGILTDKEEPGWGKAKEELQKKDGDHIVLGTAPMVRVEVLAQEFCGRAGIEKVESVPIDKIKLFLFEKGLTDPRYVAAIRRHVEEVWSKKVTE